MRSAGFVGVKGIEVVNCVPARTSASALAPSSAAFASARAASSSETCREDITPSEEYHHEEYSKALLLSMWVDG